MTAQTTASTRQACMDYYSAVASQAMHVYQLGGESWAGAIEYAFGVIPVTPRLERAGINHLAPSPVECALVKAIINWEAATQ